MPIETYHGTTTRLAASILKTGLRSGSCVSTDPLVALAYGLLSAEGLNRDVDAAFEDVVLLKVPIVEPAVLEPDDVLAWRVATGLFKTPWNPDENFWGHELLDRAKNTEIFDLGVDLPTDYLDQVERWWATQPEWSFEFESCPISGIESLRMLRAARVREDIPSSVISILDSDDYWPRRQPVVT